MDQNNQNNNSLKPIEPEYEWYDIFGLGEPTNKATIDARNKEIAIANTRKLLAPKTPIAAPEIPITRKLGMRTMFPGELEKKMAEPIKFVESSGKTNATNVNKNGTVDTGLFGINDSIINSYNEKNNTKLTKEDLKIPEVNEQVYYWLAQQNITSFLNSQGRYPTPEEFAIIHHRGYTGGSVNLKDKENVRYLAKIEDAKKRIAIQKVLDAKKNTTQKDGKQK